MSVLLKWGQGEKRSRLNKGFRGIWDRIIGKHSRQTRENELAALGGVRRDTREKDTLIERHIIERASFHQLAKLSKESHAKEVALLHKDIADFMQIGEKQPQRDRESFRSGDRDKERPYKSSRKRDREPDRGPGY